MNSAFMEQQSTLTNEIIGQNVVFVIQRFDVPPSILVVDDDQDISLMLQDRLMLLGFHASTANHGAEGIAMFDVLIFDGILLDIQMPVMDGLTMLEKVRERYPKMPVIVMTAEGNKEKILQAMERGANDYLLKPIDLDLLAKKCHAVFGSKPAEGQGSSGGPAQSS